MLRRSGLPLLLGVLLTASATFAQSRPQSADGTAATVLAKGGARERYALLIGISKYANPSLNLNFADADALALARVLLDPEVGGYKRENVKVLVNQDATRANVMEALKEWLGYRVKPEDSVLILYSGHGALGANQDAYWVTHDADVNRLYATAVGNKEVSSLIAGLPATRKVTLIDSCYSEATAKEFRALATEAFSDFKGQGSVTITASKGTQKSVEVNGHGAFTYHLLDALRGKGDDDPNGNANGVVELDEVWRYLDRKVRETAAAQGNDQQPTMSGRWEHEVPLTVNPARGARTTVARLTDLLRQNAIGLDELTEAQKAFEGDSSSALLRSLYRLLAAGDITVGSFRNMRPLVLSASLGADGMLAANRTTAELDAARKASEATAYEVAKASESESGWAMFLSKFPETPFREEARRRMTELRDAADRQRAEPGAYAQAEVQNTEGAWDNFIRQYTTGPLATSARNRLENLRRLNRERENGLYSKALDGDLPADWDKLIADFPEGRFATEAVRRKADAVRRIEEETAYDTARKTDTVASFKAYLDRYPSGRFSEAAKKRSDQVAWLDLADVQAIPAGVFTMGSAIAGRSDERPLRQVEIDAFRMGRSEVTNELYGKFLDDTKRLRRPRDPDFAKAYMATNPRLPVVNVSYADALDFCQWLSAKVGATVRLPTEAEWEYAAASGRDGTLYPWGPTLPIHQARFKDNDPSGVKTVDRDAFPANGFGLHNMAGNVAEWVHDYYSSYVDGPVKNPTGPVSGSQRSVRGGSFDSSVSELRVASRDKLDPSRVESSVGFRIVIK